MPPRKRPTEQDPEQARKAFAAGQRRLKEGDYYAASRAFNMAYVLGYNRYDAIDALASSLMHMDTANKWAAYDHAQGLCKTYGKKNYKPWIRVAEILLALDKPLAAQRVLGTAEGLVSAVTGKELLRAQEQITALQAVANDGAAKIKPSKESVAHLLTPDVLILIGQAGVAMDPNFPLLMGRICAYWRSVVVSSRVLWFHLSLTDHKPVGKTRLWVERGAIRDVTVLRREITRPWMKSIKKLLAPSMAGIRNLDLRSGRNDWRMMGEFVELESVRTGPGAQLFLDMLAPNARSLTSIYNETPAYLAVAIQGCPIPHSHLLPENQGASYLPRTGVPLQPIDPAQLASVVYFHLERTLIGTALPCLLRCMPRLEVLELGRGYWFDGNMGAGNHHNDPLSLPHLKRLGISQAASQHVSPGDLDAPNVTDLVLHEFTSDDITVQLREPLAARLLPNLTSLDIGGCCWTTQSLLNVFPELVSLRFLNISDSKVRGWAPNDIFTGLAASTRTATPLLPKLTALATAGYHDLLDGCALSLLATYRSATRPSEFMRRGVAPLTWIFANSCKFTEEQAAHITSETHYFSYKGVPHYEWSETWRHWDWNNRDWQHVEEGAEPGWKRLGKQATLTAVVEVDRREECDLYGDEDDGNDDEVTAAIATATAGTKPSATNPTRKSYAKSRTTRATISGTRCTRGSTAAGNNDDTPEATSTQAPPNPHLRSTRPSQAAANQTSVDDTAAGPSQPSRTRSRASGSVNLPTRSSKRQKRG